MATLVGLENSNFDTSRYREEMTNHTICPHCGKSSHESVILQAHIISTQDIPIYDEEVLKAAIETDTLDFGLDPSEWYNI